MNKKNKLFIASKNKGKIKDFENLFKSYEIESLLDYSIDDVEETGTTFTENAFLKAKTISEELNIVVISDDSGLECSALNGAPGIHSARYAKDHDDLANNKLLLENLKGKNRSAKFVSVICLYYPNGDHYLFRGEVEGIILEEFRGTGGFGYDPLFFIESLHKTFAQMEIAEKNKISHRARAIEKLTNSKLL